MSSSVETCTGCSRCRARQTAGHGGPYSPREFMDVFGIANPPTVVEMPEELATLGIEVDAATDRYDRAKDGWHQALIAHGHARGDEAKRETDRNIAAAKAVVEEEAERLRAARAAYTDLSRRFSVQRAREVYDADRTAQEAARLALRADDASTFRKRMGAIRDRVGL